VAALLGAGATRWGDVQEQEKYKTSGNTVSPTSIH